MIPSGHAVQTVCDPRLGSEYFANLLPDTSRSHSWISVGAVVCNNTYFFSVSQVDRHGVDLLGWAERDGLDFPSGLVKRALSPREYGDVGSCVNFLVLRIPVRPVDAQ